jgi:hypothetical protein
MVEEPPHVKQLFLIHLCKIGLTANTQWPLKLAIALPLAYSEGFIFLGVLSNASRFLASMWSTVSVKRTQKYTIERIFSVATLLKNAEAESYASLAWSK